MLQPDPRLRLPSLEFVRTPEQRAVLGRFCVSATAVLVPDAIEHRVADGLHITWFRRRLGRLPLPIVYALAETHSSSIRAAPDQITNVVRDALRGEPGSDVIRVFVAGAATDVPAARSSCSGYATLFQHAIPEAVPLTDDYEAFLATLGPHIRRDMRRLVRNAVASGLRFDVTPADRSRAGERHALGQVNAPAPYREWQIDAIDRFVVAQDGGFHAELRSADGTLLSSCAAFIADGAATLLYQLNHGGFAKASLSLTMRALLIRHLIGQGVTELLFPGGAAGLLSHACQVREGSEIVLIDRSAAALARAAVIAALRPSSHIGLAMRELVRSRWLAPAIAPIHPTCR